MSRVQSFWSSDRGATATEYAVLVGFIVVVIVGGISAFGTALSGWFDDLAASLDALL